MKSDNSIKRYLEDLGFLYSSEDDIWFHKGDLQINEDLVADVNIKIDGNLIADVNMKIDGLLDVSGSIQVKNLEAEAVWAKRLSCSNLKCDYCTVSELLYSSRDIIVFHVLEVVGRISASTIKVGRIMEVNGKLEALSVYSNDFRLEGSISCQTLKTTYKLT